MPQTKNSNLALVFNNPEPRRDEHYPSTWLLYALGAQSRSQSPWMPPDILV